MGTVLGVVAAGSVGSGLVSLGLAGVACRNRDQPAAPAFGWLMLAICGWCFASAGYALAGRTELAYLWELIIRVSSIQVAPLLLVFVLSYTGYTRWLEPRWLALLWSVPGAATVLVVTGAWHDLAAGPGDVVIATANGVRAPVVPDLFVESVQTTVAYALILLSLAVLTWFLMRSRATHHRQAVGIAVGALIPSVVNVAFQVGVTVHPGIDLTPLTFALSGVVMGWALFRYDLLTSSPIATDLLVEQLPDPVLVLDDRDRVVDYNRATARTLGGVVTHAPVDRVAPGVLDVDGEGVYELPDGRTANGDATRFYDVRVTPIEDQHGIERGRLVVLRDVTGQRRRQDRLEALQDATRQFIAAETTDEIAGLAVDVAVGALDREGVAVYRDGDGLSVEAAGGTIASRISDDDPTPGVGDSPVRAVLDDPPDVVEVSTHDAADPFNRVLLVPVGDRRLLAIWASDDEIPQADRRFAAILSRATQVALQQVEREQELRDSRRAVERRSEQIEFFNGVLRHRLRNALLVIRGRVDMLQERVDGDANGHLDSIDQWCEQLAELTEEIREIHETVTATEEERLDVVDLSPLLRERLLDLADEHEVDVTLDVSEDAVPVYANDLLAKVLDSVLGNAVEHNDADRPRVAVRTRHLGDRVHVLIEDNGPGMSDDLKERVFERDVAANHTADGFGLHFVSIMMNLYGGTVWFEDNDPRGTVAVLEFDVAGPGSALDSPSADAQNTSATD